MPSLRSHQWMGLAGKNRGVGELVRHVTFLCRWLAKKSVRKGWLLALYKASLMLIIEFIMRHCIIRAVTRNWNSFGLLQGRLRQGGVGETIEHLLYYRPALSRLRLTTLGRDFFEHLDSLPSADIIPPFPTSSPFPYLLYHPLPFRM